MKAGAALALLVAVGCGPPTKLTALPNKQISLLVDFDRAPPDATAPPSVSAFLQYEDDLGCAALSIGAAIDGVALTADATTSGNAGGVCLVGYVLSGAAPPAAPQSTLTFSDKSGSARYVTANLFDARGVTAAATSASAGDKIGRAHV